MQGSKCPTSGKEPLGHAERATCDDRHFQFSPNCNTLLHLNFSIKYREYISDSKTTVRALSASINHGRRQLDLQFHEQWHLQWHTHRVHASCAREFLDRIAVAHTLHHDPRRLPLHILLTLSQTSNSKGRRSRIMVSTTQGTGLVPLFTTYGPKRKRSGG